MKKKVDFVSKVACEAHSLPDWMKKTGFDVFYRDRQGVFDSSSPSEKPVVPPYPIIKEPERTSE